LWRQKKGSKKCFGLKVIWIVGMFLPVQLAAAKALGLGKEWYDEVNKVYRERREKVFELLDLLKCKFSKEQAGCLCGQKFLRNIKLVLS
jgi:Aspartate/tyrosine/aromatic aminotransferase